MAAQVSHLIRALNRCHKQDDQTHRSDSSGGGSTALITRDLLGESFSASKTDGSQELDLDLQVPAGWERRLDLKSGKIYLQNCCPAPSQKSNSQRQDIKCSSTKRSLSARDDITSLDLKLVSSATPPSSSSCSYQSVCTLDKVKSALDRAKTEQMRRMFFPRWSKSPPQQSSTSSKATLNLEEEVEEDAKSTSFVPQKQGLLTAAGCPNCLMYVMISEDNPKCPKCNSLLSLPVKKPRIDLNLNISA